MSRRRTDVARQIALGQKINDAIDTRLVAVQFPISADTKFARHFRYRSSMYSMEEQVVLQK